MTAYYNELDKYAAQWLRNLIVAGHIAPGDVDDRSIEDVRPSDLRGYTQCHFFAGIGVWSHALRSAGWSDDRPIWTGSCPCQPFSAAGKGDGFADERHLWPAFNHLIEQCRPPAVLGEQVASKAVDPWIDLVQDDMEALGYRFGAVAFPSAGVGAPHIRDRTYWVADAGSTRTGGHPRTASGAQSRLRGPRDSDGVDGSDAPVAGGAVCRLADADCARRQPESNVDNRHGEGMVERGKGVQSCHDGTDSGRLADPDDAGSQGCDREHPGAQEREEPTPHSGSLCPADNDRPTGPTNGLWTACDWLYCRDGRWRPVEPGTFPLAHGAASRVGRLRAYGNAINAKAAQAFIEAVIQSNN